jgi:hypothetical protein
MKALERSCSGRWRAGSASLWLRGDAPVPLLLGSGGPRPDALRDTGAEASSLSSGRSSQARASFRDIGFIRLDVVRQTNAVARAGDSETRVSPGWRAQALAGKERVPVPRQRRRRGRIWTSPDRPPRRTRGQRGRSRCRRCDRACRRCRPAKGDRWFCRVHRRVRDPGRTHAESRRYLDSPWQRTDVGQLSPTCPTGLVV